MQSPPLPRLRRWRLALLLPAAIIPFSGCHDVLPPVVAASEPPAPARQSVQPITQGPRTRFGVEVTLRGSFKPGNPLIVTATFTGHTSTEDATLSLWMPEVSLGSRYGWHLPNAPRDDDVTALATLRSSLAAGETRVLSQQVRIDAPGYYRVIAMARPTTSIAHSEPSVVETTAEEFWFLVTEEGGARSQQFDLSVIPPQYEKVIGPFRQTNRLRRSGPSSSELSTKMQASLNSTQPVRFVRYWNNDAQGYVPFSAGYVTWIHVNSMTGEEWVGGSVGIGSDGGFQVTCPQSFDSETYWKLNWAGIDTYLNAAPYYGGYENAYSCTQPDPTMFVLPSIQAHVLTNMNQIVTTSRAFFQHSRGPLGITLGGAFGTGNYNWWNDRITIYNNEVWGQQGKFVQAHEYGHALDRKALGAAVNIFGGCPSPHYINAGSNLQCALSEGFANYHAYSAWGTGIFHTLAWGEGNMWTPRAANGSTWEAAVGALLYDLSDPANEAWDQVSFTGHFVARLLRDCRVNQSGIAVRSNGIDHFIHCLERALVPRSLGYFQTRSPWPLQVTPNVSAPGSWNQSALRTLWLRNLYPQ